MSTKYKKGIQDSISPSDVQEIENFSQFIECFLPSFGHAKDEEASSPEEAGKLLSARSLGILVSALPRPSKKAKTPPSRTSSSTARERLLCK